MHESQPVENYQTRVGALRREKTRNRLIESALGVFAEKGPDAPLIDDFIAAAGVARGPGAAGRCRVTPVHADGVSLSPLGRVHYAGRHQAWVSRSTT
jgi:hypothetical protein